VGPVVASSIAGFFKSARVKETLKKTQKKPGQSRFIKPEGSASALVGKSFVFTGELKTFSRSEAEAKVRDPGRPEFRQRF